MQLKHAIKNHKQPSRRPASPPLQSRHGRLRRSRAGRLSDPYPPTPAQVPSSPPLEHARQVVAQQSRALKAEYGLKEPALAVTMAPKPEAHPDSVLTADSVERLIGCLRALPHGVVKWSHAVPGGRTARAGGRASGLLQPAAQHRLAPLTWVLWLSLVLAACRAALPCASVSAMWSQCSLPQTTLVVSVSAG